MVVARPMPRLTTTAIVLTASRQRESPRMVELDEAADIGHGVYASLVSARCAMSC